LIDRNGELHAFLYREVRSDESLHIILFLASQPAQGKSLEAIRERIARTDETVNPSVAAKRIEIRLRELIEKDLVVLDAATGMYRYASGNPNDAKVKALLALSEAERATAARMIYVVPRLSGPEAFAEAFNWPKSGAR
jgi:hypothetical protein